jgi:hypothetical protein
VRLAEVIDEVEIFAEGWVIADVGFEAGPVIGINKMVVCPMHDVYVPSHQAHLQAEDGLIRAIVRKEKLDCITVSHPQESTPVAHMAYFVHSPVPAESFA